MQPEALAVDSAGDIYVMTPNQVRKISAATGFITTVAGYITGGYSGDGEVATSAQLSSSIGIAVDSSGDLYIADGANKKSAR